MRNVTMIMIRHVDMAHLIHLTSSSECDGLTDTMYSYRLLKMKDVLVIEIATHIHISSTSDMDRSLDGNLIVICPSPVTIKLKMYTM